MVSGLLWLLSAILLTTALLAAWRFFRYRPQGSAMAIRTMPTSGIHGWRFGSAHYSYQTLKFYKLRSIRPGEDLNFNRSSIELLGQRDTSSAERTFFGDGEPVFIFSHGDTTYEAHATSLVRLAFTAWIESAPDIRTDRMSVQELRHQSNSD
ncbi:DUF2550 domain-containing protein [Corynebacterium sp. ES2794-CONJ1]|uniref:DUF2550 domain-containing protein n=1 Tax=unclassified Corynebacterium TaxID=2624378 RepID=UPI00216A22F9|nr:MULTISPECIES: DUF2550 domain-containing protein [unclassified Corynebacterium]MCS4489817.1 DUF2550 domain-containing protein [Corynebacterium sp. ES2775-CONJ]MCS4491819.1 DUF2550 domain-containing protein [Corynebacterium sp. ES2715-CONJ3]MCS4531924.1 DUF2550 domain-containing protein [Corynebacterium sp. ES2730-CONJ]MCU9519325.1 DUF2550 domain-containing protein [Corynebacterium sp. ES2794-CONJ1]